MEKKNLEGQESFTLPKKSSLYSILHQHFEGVDKQNLTQQPPSYYDALKPAQKKLRLSTLKPSDV